jgi:hypothetical protein
VQQTFRVAAPRPLHEVTNTWNRLDPSWLLMATTNGTISSLTPSMSTPTAIAYRDLYDDALLGRP